MLTLVCHRCGNPAAHRLVQRSRWFTLFFIPVIPLGVTRFTTCTFCGASYKVSKENAQQMIAASQQGAPQMQQGAPPMQQGAPQLQQGAGAPPVQAMPQQPHAAQQWGGPPPIVPPQGTPPQPAPGQQQPPQQPWSQQ